jgi:hypothetical protein
MSVAIAFPLRMPRLAIHVASEDHQMLKAITALGSMRIKASFLNRAYGDAPSLDGMSGDEAFFALAKFLEPRIEQARRGQLSGKPLEEIRREDRTRAGTSADPCPATTWRLPQKKTFGVYGCARLKPGHPNKRTSILRDW